MRCVRWDGRVSVAVGGARGAEERRATECVECWAMTKSGKGFGTETRRSVKFGGNWQKSGGLSAGWSMSGDAGFERMIEP